MARKLRLQPRTRDEKWMKKFTEMLAREFGLDCIVKFSTRAYSLHRTLPDGSHLIAYGEGDIARCQRGFCEYKSWQHLWPGYKKMRGQWALWGLVIHEFAHAVAGENGYRRRGSVHNYGWAKVVRDLQKRFTFIDTLAL